MPERPAAPAAGVDFAAQYCEQFWSAMDLVEYHELVF